MSADRWRRIVAAARRLFVDRGGVAAVSLEDVAREARLTKGGLQYHFRTRQEIVDAVRREVVAEAAGPCGPAEARAWARVWLALLVHSWGARIGAAELLLRPHPDRARAVAALTSGEGAAA